MKRRRRGASGDPISRRREDDPMSDDSEAKAGRAIELRWAAMEPTAKQFDHFCEAAPHVAALLRRVPRDRSRWDEPANVFVFPPDKPR
jgi:hypothetical protein